MQKSVIPGQISHGNFGLCLANIQQPVVTTDQIFCFQIKLAPWMAQFMAQFFPDCVICGLKKSRVQKTVY